MSSPSANPSIPNVIVLSDARLRQRVASSGFCPDGDGVQNQIQIECCARDAPIRRVPNRNTTDSCISRCECYLPLTRGQAVADPGSNKSFDPELTTGLTRG